MTARSWNGISGIWNVGTLWSGNAVPGAGDTALITAAPSLYTVLLNDTEFSAGVTLNAAGATLQLTGDLALTGTLQAQAGTLLIAGTLDGGTLREAGATIRFVAVDPVTKEAATPTLNNVTIDGVLDLRGSNATVGIRNLKFASSTRQIEIGGGAQLLVLDTETLSGDVIDLAGGVLAADDFTLSIASDTVITQNVAGTTARIGASAHPSLFGQGVVTNAGTILVEAGTLVLAGAAGAVGTGATASPPVINTGTIAISNGATLVYWASGSIASLGTVMNNGGQITLEGTLANAGAILSAGATGEFSRLQLDGTINGGTIAETGGTVMLDDAVLNAVTLTGTLSKFDQLTLGKDVALNPGGARFELDSVGGAKPSSYGVLYLNDGAVLDNAHVGFASGATSTMVKVNSGSGTLAAGTTIDVGAGQFLTLGGGGQGVLVDNATINVASGGTLRYTFAPGFTGTGTIAVSPGAVVEVDTALSLSAFGTLLGSGGTLINNGTLDLGGVTVPLAGYGPFSTIASHGVFANGTLVQGVSVAAVDQVGLTNATFRGGLRINTRGTLAVSGDLQMTGVGASGRGTIDATSFQPAVFVNGIGNSVQFLTGGTLSNASILVSGLKSYVPGTSSSVGVVLLGIETFAPDVLVQAGTLNGPVSIIGGRGILVNQGTIAVAPGADLFVTPFGTQQAEAFVNTGQITIAAGGTLDVTAVTSIHSLGSIVGAGLLRLSNITNGVSKFDNAGNTLHVGPAGYANLQLDFGVVVSGGTIVSDGGTFASTGGRLDGVTLIGPLHLSSAVTARGDISGGVLGIINGGTLISQSVTVDANSSFSTAGDENFTSARLKLGGNFSAKALGFDTATTVDVNGHVFTTVDRLLNAGTITIDPGADLTLRHIGSVAAPALAGTIVVNGGSLIADLLDAGQTIDVRAGGTVSVSATAGPSTLLAFQGPGTLTIGKGAAFGAKVAGFGRGAVIKLTGYQDGTALDPATQTTTALAFDSAANVLDVVQTNIKNGITSTTTLAAIAVDPGYVASGFTLTPVGFPPFFESEYDITYAQPGSVPVPPPTVSGTLANQPIADVQSSNPFSAVVVGDPNSGAIETAIVKLTVGNVAAPSPIFVTKGGTLAVTAGGKLNATSDTFSITGTASAVQAGLRGLMFVPIAHGMVPGTTLTATFALEVSDQTGIATDTTTSVVVTASENGPVLGGIVAAQFDTDRGVEQPFSGLTITDPDYLLTETATVRLSNPSAGTLMASGGGTVAADGSFSATGRPDQILNYLRSLTLMPNRQTLPSGATFSTYATVTIADGIKTVSDSTTKITFVATTGAVSGATPRIDGTVANQSGSRLAPISPFANVTIIDADASATDTIVVTPSDPTQGGLSNLGPGSLSANGSYTVSGTPAQLQADLRNLVYTPSAGSSGPLTTQFAVIINNGQSLNYDMTTSVTVPCFVTGTRIATPTGEVAVENLVVGDLVSARLAGPTPIIWLGYRRVDSGRHPHPAEVWPVRVRAGAFADGLPARDLWLSPDHAVMAGDVLIPIKYLVNDATIVQVPVERVTYFHVELERHDLVLADGLPAETYLDVGERSKFANQPVTSLYPDFSALRWEAGGCAPLVVHGPVLAAAREMLLDRARFQPSADHKMGRRSRRLAARSNASAARSKSGS